MDANRYGAVKSALMAAFGLSWKTCSAVLDSVRYDSCRPSVLLAKLADVNRAAGLLLLGDAAPQPCFLPATVISPPAEYCFASTLHARVCDAREQRLRGPRVVTHPTVLHPSLLCLLAEAPRLHVIQPGTAAGAGARYPIPSTPTSTNSTEVRFRSIEASLRRLEAAFARSPALMV